MKKLLITLIGIALAATTHAQTDPDFFKYKKQADDCFAKKDYACAEQNYKRALVVKANDEYCKEQLGKIKISNATIKTRHPSLRYGRMDIFSSFLDGYVELEKSNYPLIMDKSGNFLFEYKKYLDVNYLGFKKWAVKNDKELWGIIDETGTILKPFIYKYLGDNFSENLLWADLPNSAAAHCLDLDLNVVFEVGNEFDYAYDFQEGLSEVKKNEKHGFINNKGKLVIPLQYEDAGEFDKNLCPVKQDGKWGAIDKNNKVIIPFLYDVIVDFEQSISIAKMNGKYGVINTKGSQILPFVFDEIVAFYDINRPNYHLFYVQQGEQRKLVDKNQNTRTLINNGFEVDMWEDSQNNIIDITESLIKVKSNEKVLFFDINGKQMTDYYDNADGFHEGMCGVMKDGKWGFINNKGVEVIKTQFDGSGDFSEGLASVLKQGKRGYIDSKGQIKIPFLFDTSGGHHYPGSLGKFSEGLSHVSKNGTDFYINKAGQCVLLCP